MAFASDMLALVEAELLRRAAGGFVESYAKDSDSIQTMPTDKLEKLRQEYAGQASSELSGSMVMLADLRGRR